MQTWKEWGSWSKLYFNSLQLFPLFVTSHVSRMMMFPEQVEWDSISESSTWCLDICFLTAVALVRKILNRQKTQQKYFVVFAKKNTTFLTVVIFCLLLSSECRRDRGIHCCPKQRLLWERHCVHENPGHSCGTYQDLLHWQFWQPCMDNTNTVTSWNISVKSSESCWCHATWFILC